MIEMNSMQGTINRVHVGTQLQASRRNRKVLYWILLILALLAFAAAIAVLVYTLTNPTPAANAGGVTVFDIYANDVTPSYDPRSLLVASGLALAGLLMALLARKFFAPGRFNYVGEGCPQCGEHDIIRIRRQNSDRVLSLGGAKLYRYACRNCTWEGSLIGLNQYRQAYDDEQVTLDQPPAFWQGTDSKPSITVSSESLAASDVAAKGTTVAAPAAAPQPTATAEEVQGEQSLRTTQASQPAASPVTTPFSGTVAAASQPRDLDPDEFEQLCLEAVRKHD